MFHQPVSTSNLVDEAQRQEKAARNDFTLKLIK